MDKNTRTRGLRYMSLLYVFVLVVANMATLVFYLAIMMPLTRPYYEDYPEINPVSPILLLICGTIIPFMVPTVLNSLYMIPVGKFGRALRHEPQFEIPEWGLARIQNAPIITSLFGMTGWLSAWLMLTPLYIYQGALSLSDAVSFTSVMFIDFALLAVLCFIISYYTLDFANRRFYIPVFFPHGELSTLKGVIRLSIMSRFFIYFFAASFIPLATLSDILYNIPAADDFKGKGYTFIAAYLMLGAFLTWLIARSFQNPLVEMKEATDEIRRENYEVKVSVTSSDELGNLGEGINTMSRGLREKEFIKETFGRVVDPTVRDHLLKGNVGLGGSLARATILFADIRDFTTISESLAPQQIVAMLNRYFEKTGLLIAEEKGLVNKYIGDAVMALFGVPSAIDAPDDAAVRAAIALQRELGHLNREFAAEGLPAFNSATGIHAGDVLVGNIGSQSRMEFTVIGDNVNLASRLVEGLNRVYGSNIIVSEQVFSGLADPTIYHFRFLDKIRVKGKREPAAIFEILDPLDTGLLQQKLELKNSFEHALMLYFEHDFAGALVLFETIARQCPDDVAAALYCTRCHACLDQGVPDDWDGISIQYTK